MPRLDLYESKTLQDEELPVQINHNFRDAPCEIFFNHWHEHIEIHYIVEGEADFHLGQQHFHACPGDILIANRNELHTGWCTRAPYHAWVVNFDVPDLSQEIAKKNYPENEKRKSPRKTITSILFSKYKFFLGNAY